MEAKDPRLVQTVEGFERKGKKGNSTCRHGLLRIWKRPCELLNERGIPINIPFSFAINRESIERGQQRLKLILAQKLTFYFLYLSIL